MTEQGHGHLNRQVGDAENAHDSVDMLDIQTIAVRRSCGRTV
jgi:hypothetical protein